MAYEIVKGLELPGDQNQIGYNTYPFGAMEVGDAFVFPISDKDKVRPAASYYGTRSGKGVKFTVRRYASEQYPDGYACKRIA